VARHRSQTGACIQGSEGQELRLRQGLELPPILAAAEPLAAIYRSLNSCPHLVDPGIPGSP
jgi:hypothetical protein